MGLIRYILESENRRNIKLIESIATKVDALSEKYSALTDEELKGMTGVLKERLNKGETLDDILCDAFATVREASYRVLNMRHYFVQIMGGICLHQGRIAEMKTGEGKTLVSTLPAYLNALEGKGVHVVTVNDYLAKRDAEWMGKVYRFLGLSCGVVAPGMDDDEKREAYACDITYCTNNELGFDYLRDNLKVNIKSLMQRDLHFAIVDEVDSILIDEARTPLIISGQGDKSSELYSQVNRFVKTLTVDEDFTIDEKEKSVQITEQGGAKAERFFGLSNVADIENADLNHHIQQALKANYIFKRDNDYVVQDGEILIVDEFTGRILNGRRYSDGLHQAIEAKENVKVRNENKTYATITFQNFFRLYKKLSGMTGTAKTEEEEFRSIYNLDVLEIRTNAPVIRKDYPDCVYSTEKGKMRNIVAEIERVHETGQPILVGTITVEKSEELSKMLLAKKIKHEVLNAKNHAKEAEIIAQAGKLNAVTIATNMAGRGTDILLGGNPEYLAKQKLRNKGIENEKIELATSFVQDVDDEIKALREEYNAIYKDFKAQTDEEKKKVQEVGGLYILGTERHESRRIDNQLRGRSGRQGDPGCSRFFLSLEDDLVRRFGGDSLKRVYDFFKVDEDTPIESKMISKRIQAAQATIEGMNFATRKSVIKYDDVMNTQREVIYKERSSVLKGENVHEQILKYIPWYVQQTIDLSIDKDDSPTDWDIAKFNRNIEMRLLPLGTEFFTEEKAKKWDYENTCEKLEKAVFDYYENKVEEFKEKGIDFYEIERMILLKAVDGHWIDHIDEMDKLRRGIVLRAYAQMDPVVAYKQEGTEMFDDMIERIQENTIKLLLKIEVRNVEVVKPQQEKQNLVANDSEGKGVQAKSKKKVGRNDPCPCGSGKKYKNCCGR